MPSKLEELVRQASVPLTDSADNLLGTAFFIAPGLAVTAAHVIHRLADGVVYATDRQGYRRKLTVRAQYPQDVAPGVEPHPLPDLAVLDAEPGQFEDCPCVSLGRALAGRELVAFGYAKSIDPRSVYGRTRHDLELSIRRRASRCPGLQGQGRRRRAGDERVARSRPGCGRSRSLREGDPRRGPASHMAPTWSRSRNYSATSTLPGAEPRVLQARYNPAWRVAEKPQIEGPDPVAGTRALAQAVIREAEARQDILPSAISADALHQTIWLRHRVSADGRGESGTPANNFRQRWRTERRLSDLPVHMGDPGFRQILAARIQRLQMARETLRYLDEDGAVDECVIPLRASCTAIGGTLNWVPTSARSHARWRTWPWLASREASTTIAATSPWSNARLRTAGFCCASTGSTRCRPPTRRS